MKFIGADVIKVNKGYFGVRKCEVCGEIKSVDLLELKGVVRFFFIPIKTYVTKKYLICEKCTACFEITDEQWNYYQTYLHRRLDRKTTMEIVKKLDSINQSFINNGTLIDIEDEIYHPSLDSILDTLTKKYGHKETLQEIISVYFTHKKGAKN